MPTQIRRAQRRRHTSLLELLEPRELLSALGFGAIIHPANKRGIVIPTPGLHSPTIQHDPGIHGAGAEPASPLDAYIALSRANILLNNFGYNAANAVDSVEFSGSVGTVHVPLAFSLATTPQAVLTRNIGGGTESLYVVIDWGDGSPQTLGTFQSNSPASYTIAGTHTWTAPGDYRLSAFLIVNGPAADLPFVLHKAVGVAHVESTPQSTQPPVVLHLPLYDPLNYVPPSFPQIKLPTATPVDGSGFSRLYNFVVG